MMILVLNWKKKHKRSTTAPIKSFLEIDLDELYTIGFTKNLPKKFFSLLKKNNVTCSSRYSTAS